MPTNRKWLEHTEKAAWDTVQTLRDQLDRERKQLNRLVELKPHWPRLLSLLDAAKFEYSLAGDEPDALLQQLVQVVGRLKAESDALKQQLRQLNEQLERRHVVEVREASRVVERAERKELGARVRWFAGLLEERSLSGTRGGRPDAARVVEALELKVEELRAVRGQELLEAAVDVGYLALTLARAVRRSRQKRE